MYSRLFVFIEGDSDQRFFERIIAPILGAKHDYISYVLYSQKTPEYVNNMIKSIQDMGSEEYRTNYVFVHDFDSAPCVTSRKESLLEKYQQLDGAKIIIVKEEIESWYTAGLDKDQCAAHGLPYRRSTEHINKNYLEQRMPKRYGSMNLYLIGMIECFVHEIAMQRNASYAYFVRKHI